MAEPPGGLLLLIYAIHRRDPVFIVGQSMGMVVYVRNLMLVGKRKRRVLVAAAAKTEVGSSATPEPHRQTASDPTQRALAAMAEG